MNQSTKQSINQTVINKLTTNQKINNQAIKQSTNDFVMTQPIIHQSNIKQSIEHQATNQATHRTIIHESNKHIITQSNNQSFKQPANQHLQPITQSSFNQPAIN